MAEDWQPIKTAPKDRPLLGCRITEQDDEYHPFTMVWDAEYGWRDPHWDGGYMPTHWMNRPPRPEPGEVNWDDVEDDSPLLMMKPDPTDG